MIKLKAPGVENTAVAGGRWRCQHVRGAFDPAMLSALREKIRVEMKQSEAVSVKDQVSQSHGVAIDKVRCHEVWFNPWTTAIIRKPMISALDGYTLVNFPPQIRWVRERRQLVPWHQDVAYVAKLGPVLTCFVPLDEQPWRHSTIEFGDCAQPRAGTECQPYPHQPETVYGGFEIKERFPTRTYFQLELGDCLLFGDLAPHRTFLPMDTALERFSFEYRLSRPDALVPGKDYFDIKTQQMMNAAALK